MALPFLKSADPMKFGDQDVVKAAMAARRESCFKFPLRLEATSHFATLWCTVRPLISSNVHFVEAAKIFQNICYHEMTCIEIATGSFSRSGTTYYRGSEVCHGIVPCALILCFCDDESTAAQDVETSVGL
jgi:hypothetical protein